MKAIMFYVFAAMWVLTLGACREARTKIETAGDTGFARNTFEALARGDSKVADEIDWPVLTALGQNVGAIYTAQETPEKKGDFIEGFITQFATSFRESGGSVDGITNWRVQSHDRQRTVVVADAPKGSLRMTVSERDGEERVSSIDISVAP
jgi:hypothetical protein